MRTMNKTKRPSESHILTVCLSAGFQKTSLSAPLVLGDINRLIQSRTDAAGKGINVARILTQLHIPVVSLGQGGANQEKLIEIAAHDGLKLELIPSSKPLRLCTTILELELNMDGSRAPHAAGLPEDSVVMRVSELVEPSASVDAEVPAQLLTAFEKQLVHSRMVVISGSMAPGFPEDFHAKLVKAAHRHNIPVILDIRGDDLLLALRENTGIVKINLNEFTRTFLPNHANLIDQLEQSGASDHLGEVFETLSDLTEDQETIFILTRGPAPVLVARNGVILEIPVPKISQRDLVNPIGSGDAFSAGLAAVLSYQEISGQLEGIDENLLATAVRFGIACAQSNARTMRPGWLEPDFVSQSVKEPTQ